MNSIDSQEESFALVGLLHDDTALDRPHDVELQGNIAYVPGKGGSLAIIDVSDVTKPKLLSSLVGFGGLEDAETVLPMGDVLLLGTRDFLAVDVSDPTHPKVVKHISDRPRIDRINGMALRGNHVFTANKSGYVTVFEVSDPANLVSIAQYRGGTLFPTRRLILDGIPRYDNAHDLVYRDGYLYVTAQNDSQFGILRINDRRALELAEQSA